MSRVTSASYVVIINGLPTSFFKGYQGNRQGCPLSPYLFLLIIEGLSRMLALAKETNKIKGIKVTGSIFLTHTLFVDGVLIFGDGKELEWKHIKSQVDTFCGASRMTISDGKYAFFHFGIFQELIDEIPLHFSFT